MAEPTVGIRREALRRTSLREQVADLARSAIEEGRMRPGEIYSVPSLAQEYGVSLTPVREAMLDLVKDGLLTTVPNRGFRVVEPDPEDMREVRWLRRVLEVAALPLVSGALQAVGPEGEGPGAHVEQVIERLEQAASDGAVAEWAGADRDLHVVLVDLAGNRRLTELIASLASVNRLGSDIALADLQRAAGDHRDMVDRLRAGDLPAARRLMEECLERGARSPLTPRPGDRR